LDTSPPEAAAMTHSALILLPFGIRGFGMNRREMMKLASLAVFPVLPEAAMAKFGE